jgi:hypothetical protein
MNRKILLITVTFILFLGIFLIGIYFIKSRDLEEREESEWYSKQLDYQFCGIVVDKESLKQKWGYGYITCILNTGIIISTAKEDSLQSYLHSNQSVRFIVSKEKDLVRFLVQNINDHERDDSLCIDAKEGEINFYRKGRYICKHSIASSLKTDWFK